MTSTLHPGHGALPDQAGDPDHRVAHCAHLDQGAGCTTDRVKRLRVAILQNRDLAKSCDFNFRTQLLALANEMENYLRTLISPARGRELE